MLGYVHATLEAIELLYSLRARCILRGRLGCKPHHRRGAEQPTDGVFDHDRQGREHAGPAALQEAQEAAGCALRRPPADAESRMD